jgi:hypothetical protein
MVDGSLMVSKIEYLPASAVLLSPKNELAKMAEKQFKAYFKNPDYQANPYVSLFNDTAAYFITWTNNAGVNGKDMPTYGQNDVSKPFLSQLIKEEIFLPRDSYSAGKGYYNNDSEIHHSYFDLGEGVSGNAYNYPITTNFNNINQPDPAAGTAQLEAVVSGRNGRDHVVRISVGTDQNAALSLDTLRFTGYGFVTSRKSIPTSLLVGGNLYLKVTPLGDGSGNPDYVSITSAKVRYARLPVIGFNTAATSGYLYPQVGDTYLQVHFSIFF